MFQAGTFYTLFRGKLFYAIHFLSPFLISSISLFCIMYVLRRFLLLRYSLDQKSVFLELTPPAITDKTAYTTQQLFSILHQAGSQKTFMDKVLGKKALFSFELVSTREKGIRYIVKTNERNASVLERTLVSYLPQVRIKQVTDYLVPSLSSHQAAVIEFKLTEHFALPLKKQTTLEQHDPVSYLAGMMTKLATDELVSFQVIISPIKTNQTELLSRRILRNEDILSSFHSSSSSGFLHIVSVLLQGLLKLCYVIVSQLTWAITELFHGSSQVQKTVSQVAIPNARPARVLSSFEQAVVLSVQEKVSQPLFETSLRALVIVKEKQDRQERLQGIASALAPFTVPGYQSLKTVGRFPKFITNPLRFFLFRKRLFSLLSNRCSSLLSVSEISDVYHFPYTLTTKTENIVKAYSKQLPAPLSLKQGRDMQVIFGTNTYDGSTTSIGLTAEERETHMYVIGRTGSGKTTMLYSMASNDIASGQGMAFIDPHGDVSEDLLASIPNARMNDLVYINPIDLKHPVGINLLELTQGLDDDDAELEKEVVCEGVISLFRKVFSNEETSNAHRIEYILRNTIYTAFTMEEPTLFTIYDLLNNPPLQKQVTKNLKDENLRNFWKFEFGKAGDFQQVKMAAGVTAKIGRFLFSPTAKRILEQKKSTINFSEIMNEGKILLCNFSQGNLGEDTARLLGTTIVTKLQQAALGRAKLAKENRKPFYLYVDEFQNFATHSFIKMLSEGRKYGLSVTIAEQSTSQQQEQRLVHTILANVTTVVCFRSANPVDEKLMLAQFAPYVEQGDIANLPRYTFYIKISALESEEPFSGQTIYVPSGKDTEKMNVLIEASRKNYAIVYKKPSQQDEKPRVSKDQLKPTKIAHVAPPISAFPEQG